jgi:hypothetical protein
MVRPACRDAQVAYVHQFAPSPLLAAKAAEWQWVISRLRMTGLAIATIRLTLSTLGAAVDQFPSDPTPTASHAADMPVPPCEGGATCAVPKIRLAVEAPVEAHITAVTSGPCPIHTNACSFALEPALLSTAELTWQRKEGATGGVSARQG